MNKGIKIIEEIKKIEKAILIKDKINEMAEEFLLLCSICSSPIWASGFFFVHYLLKTEFSVEHDALSFFIVIIYFFVTVCIGVVITFKTSDYLAERKMYRNKTKKEEYMENSNYELIKLKDEHIKELIQLSVNDYELFNFIILNMDDDNLKPELFKSYNDNNEIFNIICNDPKLLSIINEVKTNEVKTNKEIRILISEIQNYLEEEEKKEKEEIKRRKIFENSINKKRKNEIEQEIKII